MRPSILMLATGTQLSYRVLRCAAAFARSVYVLGTKSAAPLRSSVGCRKYIRVSDDFYSEFKQSSAYINRLCAGLGIDTVIPSDFYTTTYLARVRGFLSQSSYPVASADTLAALNHKGRFAALCMRLGIPHPQTWMFDDGHQVKKAVCEGRIALPLVAKPTSMGGGCGVRTIRSRSDLDDLCLGRFKPVLVQRYIESQDQSVFYYCKGGNIISSVGYLYDCESIRFVDHDFVRPHALAIIRHFNYSGVIGFDIRVDPAGQVYFIECNPRFWFHMDFAMLAGLNFVQLGVDEPGSTTAAVESGLTYLKGRRCIASALSPWSMSRADWQVLAHFFGDPVYLFNAALFGQRSGSDYGFEERPASQDIGDLRLEGSA